MENVSIPHKKSWHRDQMKFDRYWSDYRHHTLSQFTRADASFVHKTIGTDRPSAANDALTFMSAMFKAAIADLNYQGPNPITGIRKYHLEGRERFLSPDELAAFFKAIAALNTPKHHRSEASRIMFMLCLMTGARRGNVAAMRWDELDLTNGVWTVPAWKTKKNKTIAIVLIPEAVAMIQLLPKVSEFVFPSSKSKSGHMSYPYRAWEVVCEKAGLENFHIHDLRRTFATYQAGCNVSLYTIAKTLGHGSIDSTAVYARLQLDAQREAVALGMSEIMRHGNPVNSVVGDKAGQSETTQD
jgi:integrase